MRSDPLSDSKKSAAMAICVPVGEDRTIEQGSGSKDGRSTSYTYAGPARSQENNMRIVAGVDCHKASHRKLSMPMRPVSFSN
jgi:hypothetical protein